MCCTAHDVVYYIHLIYIRRVHTPFTMLSLKITILFLYIIIIHEMVIFLSAKLSNTGRLRLNNIVIFNDNILWFLFFFMNFSHRKNKRIFLFQLYTNTYAVYHSIINHQTHKYII